jgi:hypothetical protein
MRQVVQLWFVGTALFLSAAMIWAFVPVLIPVLGVTAGLGLVVAAMVSVARWIERHRAG